MINGYVRDDGGKLKQLSVLSELPDHATEDGHVVWLDLEAPTPDELHDVGQFFELSPDALEDCLSGEQRPRVDEYDDHIVLVLYGMLGPVGDDELEARKLVVFCGPHYLITVHPVALRTINALKARCDRRGPNLLGRGVDHLLFEIIDGMADRYLELTDQLAEQIDELEEQSLEEHSDPDLLSDSVEMRSQLLHLRQYATSQRELLSPIARGDFEFLSDTLAPRFLHVRDHLTQVIEAIETLRERLNGVRENYHTAVAARTNATMQTLTLFATVMLPLSLLAGIYGMNLNLWPGPETPGGFWMVMGTMLALGVVLFVYVLRRFS